MSLEFEQQIKARMQEKGIEPPARIQPGLQRFGPKNSYWCHVHADPPPTAIFGDWRTGEKFTVKLSGQSHTYKAPSALEIKAMREARRAEKRRLEDAAAKAASQVLTMSHEVFPDAEYLIGKGINTSSAVRQLGEKLIVPAYDVGGVLRTIQYIFPDGKKLFLKNGRKNGCYNSIGSIRDRIYICEGLATASSVHEATGHCVVIAFDCGNLPPVSRALAAKYPGVRIIFAADNDEWTEGNPGLTKAREAAQAIGAEVIVPKFKDLTTRPTDWNDLACLQGLEEVRRQVLDE